MNVHHIKALLSLLYDPLQPLEVDSGKKKKVLTDINVVLLAEKLCTWRYKMATRKAVSIAHVWYDKVSLHLPTQENIVIIGRDVARRVRKLSESFGTLLR